MPILNLGVRGSQRVRSLTRLPQLVCDLPKDLCLGYLQQTFLEIDKVMHLKYILTSKLNSYSGKYILLSAKSVSL